MKSLKILISVIFPPLGVLISRGFSKSFWLNIPLTLMGVIPGVIHAIWCLEAEKSRLRLDRWSVRT